MNVSPSRRVSSIGNYAFAEIDRQVDNLRKRGIEIIDFGVGDPTTPPPKVVLKATKNGVEKHRTTGYPSYIGMPEYRQAIAEWMLGRFGVDLDPASEITSTLGSKEGIFNFAEGFVNPGDVVIVPTPGYPPYTRGTIFAEGEVYYTPLLPENGYLINLESIPNEIAERAKIIWVNYPNNPTGAMAGEEFYRSVVEWGHEHDVIVASDEAYSELYYTEKPPMSILNVARGNVVVFQSLSKRSAMTGYRVGWVAGDADIIDTFKKVKTNIDSGTPNFIQEGAIAALGDEDHVEQSRSNYMKKRDLLADAFTTSGLEDCRPAGTIYLWQKVPAGYNSVDFATRLLEPDIAIVSTPGTWISNETQSGLNPGEGFVRLALVPSIESTEKAADRISKAIW